MAHAEICPVCGGSGQAWVSNPNSSSVGYYTVCHGCGGCGWVTIDDGDGVAAPPCDTCPWRPQPYIPYEEPWTPWNPHEHEWWYTSDNISIRVKFGGIFEKPVDCGGIHPF